MSPEPLVPPLDHDDHLLGPHEAPLELVMFGDFQCPYCAGAQGVLSRVRERLGGRLRFGFRHMPLVDHHPMALAAAELAEAAGDIGRFWEAHDALYRRATDLTDAAMFEVMEEVGVDATLFRAGLADGRWRPRIERDVASASASGVDGTPAFFVNGIRHTDVYDAGSLVRALEAGPR